MKKIKLFSLFLLLLVMLLGLSSCGYLIPFTVQFRFENEYELNNEQKDIQIKVNKQPETVRTIKYGDFEQYVINWWKEENKSMAIEIKVLKINGVDVNIPASEEWIDDIKNQQTIKVIFTADGSEKSIVGVNYNIERSNAY